MAATPLQQILEISRRLDFDPDQPRDEGGRFAAVAAAGKAASARIAKRLPRDTNQQQTWHRNNDELQSGAKLTANHHENSAEVQNNYNLHSMKDPHEVAVLGTVQNAAAQVSHGLKELERGNLKQAETHMAISKQYEDEHERLLASPIHQAYQALKAAEAKVPDRSLPNDKYQKAGEKYRKTVEKARRAYESVRDIAYPRDRGR